VSTALIAKELTCKHKYMDEIWGEKVEACYADNYTDYTPEQAANEFLKDQIFVEGGRFNLNNNPKTFINISSYYIGKYLVPFQEYNVYLKATNQWNDGFMKGEGRARLRRDIYNGLYPATVTYEKAEGFCKWMGEQTGLDITLPNYQQWLYAATSKGKNWEYPTNNGKLEIGANYPSYDSNVDKSVVRIVTGLPVNSLGIHEFFGNNWQWTSSILSKKNAPYFNVSGQLGQTVVAGTPYTYDADQVKKFTLLSNFSKTVEGKGNQYGNLPFRCVINTDKPLPKSVN
jgi:formylglycine-generating enzyme required for sulfatase activity